MTTSLRRAGFRRRAGFFLCLFGLFFLSTACAVEPTEIEIEIRNGNYVVARSMIDQYIANGKATPLEIWNLNFRKEQMDRIERDFRADPNRVLNSIRQCYPDISPEQFARKLAQWKRSKALETMTINGEERFFHSAADNLFRIDPEAKRVKLEKEGPKQLSLDDFLRNHLAVLHTQAKETNTAAGLAPQTIRATYTLTVPPDTVPAGETIRCWLPFPRNDHRRQTEVVLLDSNLDNPILAPSEYEHCTIYSEKVAVAGTPTVFRVRFQYRATGEWFDPNHPAQKPCNKESELYQRYTAGRKNHVLFTEEIKTLSEQIVGEEKEPHRVVQKIYEAITTTYPWARSREYSTMENIPSYVIENKHGDCGMVALLLITLCRYNGIPAKWQSGFMTHPKNVGMHDWAEVYFEGIGWVPIDPSLGGRKLFENRELDNFFLSGIDSYRLIVNEDFGSTLYPAKIYPRSETVDFQRGEVEWRGGNLYFNRWTWNLDVEYLDET